MKYWKAIYKDKPKLEYLNIKVDKKSAIKFEPLFYDSETSKETHTEREGKKLIEKVDNTWVYLWMCHIGEFRYYGRYLHEFIELLQWLIDYLKLSNTRRIDIWIHNASYDVSYMYDLLFKLNGGMDDMHMLYSNTRQLICWELTRLGITIKCTYRLTNRSLDKWSKDLNVTHKKLTGSKDYNVTFYPWDPLPANEYKYGAYDIIALKECFYKECQAQGYTFANVPLTQTGFVRREFQRRYNEKDKFWQNRKFFKKTKLNNAQYQRLLRASVGGMTASNINTIGVLIEWEAGIGHVDFDSHYPTQQKINRYPMRPITVKTPKMKRNITFDELDFYVSKGYLYVIDIVLNNPRIREGVTAPFMYKSKCVMSSGAVVSSCNGKLVQVKGQVRTCCTNLDLDTYREQYRIDGYYIEALDIYTAERLPDYVLDVVDEFYTIKSDLKKDPELEYSETKKITYIIDKQKLNGIFGCCYTKPVRPEIYIDEEFNFHQEFKETLADFYEKFNSCLAYQWGVFVTAYARRELYHVIKKVIGYDAYLYCDTDSVFYRSTPEIEERVAAYRTACRRDSEKNGYFVKLADGELKYYHDLSPEHDHLKSKTFKALHAKCYAIEPDGVLHCTIAGVSAWNKDHTISREQELGSIDRLEENTEFIECGGTRADYSTIRQYELYTGGGCAVLNTKKKLSQCRFDGGINYETEELII